jgi:hypothetical protein
MFKDLLKRPLTGLLLGAGVVVLAPIVLPVLARAARPLAKAALHGYFDLVEGVKSLASKEEHELKPVVGDLVAAGVEEAATAAGEEALDEGVAEVIVEGVATALEGV